MGLIAAIVPCPKYIVNVLVADKVTSTPKVVVRDSAAIFVNRRSDLIPSALTMCSGWAQMYRQMYRHMYLEC